MEKEELENFIKHIEIVLKDLFNEGEAFEGMMEEEKKSVFTFKMREPQEVEQLFDNIKEIKGFEPIYLMKTQDNFFQCCLYSMAKGNFPFIVNALAGNNSDGLCDEVFITAYQSIEKMLEDLDLQLSSLKDNGKAIFKIDQSTLSLKFMNIKLES